MKQVTSLTVRKKSSVFLAMATFTLLTMSCQKQHDMSKGDKSDGSQKFSNKGNGNGNLSPFMVLQWNKAAIDVVRQTAQIMPDPPIPPFAESRFYAMVNIAMHDALNNIVPKYQRYALINARDKDADPDAAVAQAAHDVIVAFYGHLNAPAFVTPQPVKDNVASLLELSLADIPNGIAKTKGIALGHSAAQAILAKRSNDGIANAMFPVVQGNAPGQYRFTFPFSGPPFNSPPFSGLYDSPGWGNLTPFGITSGSQFRPGPPYAVTSAEYTMDFNEVKSLGRYNSATRSADQTEIAKFWAESSPQAWNRIATNIISEKNMNAWKVARLLALLQMSEADAYIASFDSKLHYFYWRPVTAIHLAGTDGNPNTAEDGNWEVVGWNPAGPPDMRYWPTPPVPDYTSAHATAGGAGAEVMKNFFETDNIHFSSASTSFPSTRSYSSLSQAARENSLSRIYIGYHFRKAVTEGELQGRSVGKWIFDHYLTEE
jgi:hypothetical protein